MRGFEVVRRSIIIGVSRLEQNSSEPPRRRYLLVCNTCSTIISRHKAYVNVRDRCVQHQLYSYVCPRWVPYCTLGGHRSLGRFRVRTSIILIVDRLLFNKTIILVPGIRCGRTHETTTTAIVALFIKNVRNDNVS